MCDLSSINSSDSFMVYIWGLGSLLSRLSITLSPLSSSLSNSLSSSSVAYLNCKSSSSSSFPRTLLLFLKLFILSKLIVAHFKDDSGLKAKDGNLFYNESFLGLESIVSFS